MKTRSKVLVAAAAAAALAAAAFAGTSLADSRGPWQGWHMGGGMGMHDGYGPYGMMGRHRGWGPQDKWGMHGGYGMMGGYGGWGHHGMMGMRERIRDFADRYDTDKDGNITQAEIDANRAEMFKKFDTNNDGKLTIEEYQNLWLAEHHRKMVRAFQNLDIDGTGAIDLNAYNGRLGHIVEMLDQNDDGALSRDDLKVWREHHRRGGWGAMPWKGQDRMPMMDDGNDDDSGDQGDQSQQ